MCCSMLLDAIGLMQEQPDLFGRCYLLYAMCLGLDACGMGF